MVLCKLQSQEKIVWIYSIDLEIYSEIWIWLWVNRREHILFLRQAWEWFKIICLVIRKLKKVKNLKMRQINYKIKVMLRMLKKEKMPLKTIKNQLKVEFNKKYKKKKKSKLSIFGKIWSKIEKENIWMVFGLSNLNLILFKFSIIKIDFLTVLI